MAQFATSFLGRDLPLARFPTSSTDYDITSTAVAASASHESLTVTAVTAGRAGNGIKVVIRSHSGINTITSIDTETNPHGGPDIRTINVTVPSANATANFIRDAMNNDAAIAAVVTTTASENDIIESADLLLEGGKEGTSFAASPQQRIFRLVSDEDIRVICGKKEHFNVSTGMLIKADLPEYFQLAPDYILDIEPDDGDATASVNVTIFAT